jgi:hypothetical protein
MVFIDRLARSGSLLLPAGVLLVGALLLATQVSQWGEPQSWEGHLARERRRAADLDPVVGAHLKRVEAKVEIAQKLIDGRMTLLAAAAAFCAQAHQPPAFDWGRFRARYPGATDEERHCREVITWVRLHLERCDPCLALVIPDQLEAQLAELLRRGPPPLPEVALE